MDTHCFRNPDSSSRASSTPFPEAGSSAGVRINRYWPSHDVLCAPLGSLAVRCVLSNSLRGVLSRHPRPNPDSSSYREAGHFLTDILRKAAAYTRDDGPCHNGWSPRGCLRRLSSRALEAIAWVENHVAHRDPEGNRPWCDPAGIQSPVAKSSAVYELKDQGNFDFLLLNATLGLGHLERPATGIVGRYSRR
jgi:hypothetical protein